MADEEFGGNKFGGETYGGKTAAGEKFGGNKFGGETYGGKTAAGEKFGGNKFGGDQMSYAKGGQVGKVGNFGMKNSKPDFAGGGPQMNRKFSSKKGERPW